MLRGPGRKGVLSSDFGHLPRSAPKSAFRVLFGVLGEKRQKALEKHSLGHSEAGARNHSTSTPWGTFRPRPLSTPVNGGRGAQGYGLESCPQNVLGGPAAIFFISLDTCSDSIATIFRACFFFSGYRTIIAIFVANGVSHGCACVKISSKRGGGSHHFGEVLSSLKNYRAMWGIAVIVSQYRAIWGH